MNLNANFSRVVFVAGLAAAIVAMSAVRFAMALWIRRHWAPSAINRLVIDAGGPPLTVPHAYHIDAAEHGLVPRSRIRTRSTGCRATWPTWTK